MGPVDVIIIGFPGNRFTGGIAPALLELVESGTVRIIDLLFITKDADGTVATVEIADLDESLSPAFMEIDVVSPGVLDDEDAEELSEDLPLNSSALLVAYENSWAERFAEAVRESEGIVIDQIRIPAQVVESLSAEA